MRKPYSTDLSDAEWSCIASQIPTPKAPGRPRVHPLREVLNAIFYIVRSSKQLLHEDDGPKLRAPVHKKPGRRDRSPKAPALVTLRSVSEGS
jgi:transposase